MNDPVQFTTGLETNSTTSMKNPSAGDLSSPSSPAHHNIFSLSVGVLTFAALQNNPDQ